MRACSSAARDLLVGSSFLAAGSLSSDSPRFRSFRACFRASSRSTPMASRSAFFRKSMSRAAMAESRDSSCCARAVAASSLSLGCTLASLSRSLPNSPMASGSAGASAVGTGGGMVGSGMVIPEETGACASCASVGVSCPTPVDATSQTASPNHPGIFVRSVRMVNFLLEMINAPGNDPAPTHERR